MEDYDFTLQYHLGKENVVADALSHKSRGIFASLVLEDYNRAVTIKDYDLQYCENDDFAFVYNIISTLSLLQHANET